MLGHFTSFFALTMLSVICFSLSSSAGSSSSFMIQLKRILRGTDFLLWTCFLLEPKYNFFWLLGWGKCSPFFPTPFLTYVHGRQSDKFRGKKKRALAHSFSSLRLSLKLAPWRPTPIYLLHSETLREVYLSQGSWQWSGSPDKDQGHNQFILTGLGGSGAETGHST